MDIVLCKRMITIQIFLVKYYVRTFDIRTFSLTLTFSHNHVISDLAGCYECFAVIWGFI